MKRWLRRIGMAVAGLVGLVMVAGVSAYGVSGRRLSKQFNVPTENVAVPTDAASIERGRHLAVGCLDCHSSTLAGQEMMDVPPFKLVASNLTRGKGGIGATYSDQDFVRAIRHGVRPDGKPLVFMPSNEFYYLNDADLGAIIAFIRSMPPVDNVLPKSEVRLLGRVLLAAGKLPLIPAEMIDHDAPRPAAVPEGATAAYGEYLANIGCKGCHGPNLAGGHVPGAPPSFKPSANLTPGGALASWSEADFFRTLRTGKRPDGSELDGFMPWRATAQMTDDELRALWLYLKSVPAQSQPDYK